VWLAVCGSLPPQTDAGVVRALVLMAHKHQARCAVDAFGPALLAAIEAGADLVAPNRHELGDICAPARDAKSLFDLAAAAMDLARRTGSQLLISLGQDGALYTDGNSALHAWGPPLSPINTAGAGDALLAGWLLEESQPSQRLVRAVTWGRSACLSETTVDLTPGRMENSPITVHPLDLSEPHAEPAEQVTTAT
jgi:1-phosphofructokinase